ncbi:BHLH domain-containing protein [Pseudozyma hubeiensis]|nr:BHLH domain-containing protein [Pseudozyma hubeiensis]
MARNKPEGIRGRSPGPAADRRESSLSELSIQDHDAIDAMQSSTPARTSKRRKRSELSPSSKATHSIIEKERREAMNEKFSELAANIPELVEAIAAGKRPTKGEIVKASIARHQDQERRVGELMHEVQMLRAGRDAATPSSSSFPRIETPSPVTTTVHEQMMPPTHALSLPYQIQASQPVGLPGTDAHSNLWIGQLFDKTHQQLSFDAPQPLPLLPDMMQQPVSPFKQTSMMNWNLSSLPQPLDAASFGMGLPASGILKGFMDNGMLANLARRDSVASGPTATSGFSSPTFTSSSDSDSTFSSEAVDPSLDERKFLADSMSFEPFAMPTSLPEQTPLTSLVGLPATADLLNANNHARRVTANRRARKDGVKEEAVQLSSSPLTASLVANT